MFCKHFALTGQDGLSRWTQKWHLAGLVMNWSTIMANAARFDV
jgi:hypothetical protein